jgi:hypothetical protein
MERRHETQGFQHNFEEQAFSSLLLFEMEIFVNIGKIRISESS